MKMLLALSKQTKIVHNHEVHAECRHIICYMVIVEQLISHYIRAAVRLRHPVAFLNLTDYPVGRSTRVGSATCRVRDTSYYDQPLYHSSLKSMPV